MSFLIFTYSVQVFIQNFNIDKNIQELNKTQSFLSWESLWMENFYKPFLESEYSIYFMKHKQGISLDDEIIIIEKKINTKSNSTKKNIENKYKKGYNTWTRESWKNFFSKFKNFFMY